MAAKDLPKAVGARTDRVAERSRWGIIEGLPAGLASRAVDQDGESGGGDFRTVSKTTTRKSSRGL